MEKKKRKQKVDSKTEKEYIFDILEHSLVPNHEILTEEEIRVLMEDYNITKLQLPKMKMKDPVAKRLNAKAGDVVRIKRKSYTFGDPTYYREVIDG